MTGEGIAAIIVASGGFLTSLATFISSLRNSRKIDENTRITSETSDKVTEVKQVVSDTPPNP